MAQTVRTPAWFIKHRKEWIDELPELLDNTLKEAVALSTRASREGKPAPLPAPPDDGFPLRVSRESSPMTGKEFLKAETVVGRDMWLWAVQFILTQTVKKVLSLRHKWVVLTAPAGFEWVTTDDPVMCVNYQDEIFHNFKGGWGYPGSEVLFPLSPKHVLYTRVGDKTEHNAQINKVFAERLQRLVAKHAHRWIFARMKFQTLPLSALGQ